MFHCPFKNCSAYRYTSTPADTVAAGLLGGCDLDCGSYYQAHTQVEEKYFGNFAKGIFHCRKQLMVKPSLKQTLTLH